jgi:hypothetical protein
MRGTSTLTARVAKVDAGWTRRYDVEDLAGHLWSFAEQLRDVPAEGWGAVAAT